MPLELIEMMGVLRAHNRLLFRTLWVLKTLKKTLLNNNCVIEDLVSIYCLTTSNQKEAISLMVSGWQV